MDISPAEATPRAAKVTPPSRRRPRLFAPKRVAAVIIIGGLVAALPLAPFGNSYLVSITVRALLFIMLGQAWNVIAGFGGQLSLGHGVFFGIGAYATALLFNDLAISPWIGMWAGVILAALLAVVIGLATFRSRGVYFALATVVISLGFEKVGRVLVSVTGGDAGLAEQFLGNAPAAMQFRDPAIFLWMCLAVVIAYYFLSCWLRHSRFGLRLQAVRDDEGAAAASGLNVFAIKLIGLSGSAAMTALAGALYVQFYLSIDPGTAFGLFQGIQIQLPSLIGGIGTPLGPIVGGALAIAVGEATNAFAARYGLESVDILVYGAVLLAVVLYAPRGLVGFFTNGPRRLRLPLSQ